MNKTHGSWMDEYGGCKACGGEIPHGHSNNCDIYKLQQIEDAAREFVKKVDTLKPLIDSMTLFAANHGLVWPKGQNWAEEYEKLKKLLTAPE